MNLSSPRHNKLLQHVCNMQKLMSWLRIKFQSRKSMFAFFATCGVATLFMIYLLVVSFASLGIDFLSIPSLRALYPTDLANSYYSSWQEIYCSWSEIERERRAGTFDNNEGIPRTVWMTWKDNDILSFGNVQRMKHENENWKFVLLNDTDIIDFYERIQLEDEIVKTAYRAYSLVNSQIGAARSDILRYAIMWYFGGIYVDMDSEIFDFEALYELSTRYDVILSREPRMLEYAGTERKKLLQWLLVSQPRNNVFANVVKLIHHNLVFDQPRGGIRSSYNVPMRELTVWMTGPNIFTRGVDVTMMQNTEEENAKIYIYGTDYDGLAIKKAKDIFWGTATAYSQRKNYRSTSGVFRLSMDEQETKARQHEDEHVNGQNNEEYNKDHVFDIK
mmetsp:Transcript_12620/g.19105  ORF Transcript_12620/g.19105 Transcript_12620/m.19105 type:complete len:389 (+) Transcript_12620:66-1232(+)